MIRIIEITLIALLFNANGIEQTESESDAYRQPEVWSNVLQEWAIK